MLTGLVGVVWLLAVPRLGTAQTPHPPEPSTEGFYTLQVSSRTFDTQLFGDGATSRAQVLLNQALPGIGTLALWLERGFPSVSTDFGAELRDMALWGGEAQLSGGDFLLRPVLPRRSAVSAAASRSFYPLQGVRFKHEGARSQWNLFAGRAKRFRKLLDQETETPTLFGVRHLRRIGTHHIGFSFTGVEKPTFVTGSRGQRRTGIVGGTYYRNIRPWLGVLAEVHTTGADVGGRAGSLFRFGSGEIATMLYTFGDEFPFVFPLFRPGESGLTVSSQVQLSEFTSVFAHVDYVLATQIDERSDLRAEVGLGKSFGSNRPHLYLSYSHNEIIFDSPISGDGTGTVDLFTLSVTRNAAAQLLGLRLEHLIQSTGGQNNQTRSHLFYRRLLRQRSFFNATLDALVDEDLNYRLTGETSVERRLWRSYNYLAGVGATYQENMVQRTGEGLLRVGISRRIARSGLFIRLELAQPFSIGLPRSRDPGVRFTLDVGHRMVWNSLAALQTSFLPTPSARQYGSIEGEVLFEGRGVGRVTIYVNGEPRGTTNRRGRFRIRRVPTGPATVRLDIREFETEYGVVGGPARQVTVPPRRTVQADFELAVMRYFQGSIVTCDADAVVPLADVEVTLRGQGIERTLRTSRVGGFQFDELPPGRYELTVPPTAPGEAFHIFPVDLTQDRAGFLLRINCD